MILQYKGFNNNWVYEEADIITSAVVYIGDILERYQEGGAVYKEMFAPLYTDGKTPDEEMYHNVDLAFITRMHKEVDNKIIEETRCADEITYHFDAPFGHQKNVTVVTLNDKNKYITRVFESGVYLLNGKGQTVQKLA